MRRRPIRFLLNDPWGSARAAITGGLNTLGAALIGAAWVQTSNTARLGDQIGALNLAIAGLGVALTAHLAWLVHGRRRVTSLRRLILVRPTESAPARLLAAIDDPVRVAVPSGSRYHRRTCPLVAGKATDVVRTQSHRALSACEVCRP